MKLLWNSNHNKALTVALIIALLFGAYFLRSYFTLIIFASIMAFLFSPVYNWFLGKVKRKGSAASLTFLVSLFVIILPFILLLIITFFQLKDTVGNLPNSTSYDFGRLGQQILDNINKVLANIPGTHPLTPESIANYLTNLFSNVAKSFLNAITTSIGSFISMFTWIIIYIYVFVAILLHSKDIVKVIKKLNPLGEKTTDTYLSKMGAMTKAMVRGQFIIATLQGLAGALSFYVIGAHSIFIFLWFLFSLLCIIPLGSGIVIIPTAIIMILFGNIWQGVFLLLVHFLITTNIDNILRPRLVPKDAKLNSALTILGVFAGISMFGFLGIVIGPVIMILITTTVTMYLEAQKALK